MSYMKAAKISDANKHNADVPVLLLHNGKLFSGGNDGKIKIWNHDLKLENTIEAHPVNVYDLAADEEYLYSCSNDETVKVWSIGTGTFVKAIERSVDADVVKIFCTHGRLYTGDILGNILIYKNDEIVGQYGTLEEVTGVCAKGKFLFTAGQRDFTVTEMIPESKTQFSTRKCESGRGPLRLLDDKVCFINAKGRTILVMDTNPNFKTSGKLEGHELIVNALCQGSSNENTLYSGGYDKILKSWDIGTEKCVGSAEVGSCIYALAVSDNGKEIFVSSGDGNIDKFVLS